MSMDIVSMDIVLVHGSGGTAVTWDEVVPRLAAAGHRVHPVTNPMRSLAGDVARTTELVDGLAGPVLLVGHSYGGAVITNAGRHARVRGLVYVAAFGPDQGESVRDIVERYPPAKVSAFMRRGPNGEWSSAHTDAYWAQIGWDLTPAQRQRWDAHSRANEDLIFTQPTGVPAWRTKPSWYLVAADDATLRPEIQRDAATRMGATVAEVPGSHFTPLVHPEVVAGLISQALRSLA